jgi:hypothetical protein
VIQGKRLIPKPPRKDTAAADSFNQICTVRIELLNTDPLIWREVEVPTSITLGVLNNIIQITMGWLDQHLWEFTIDKKSYGPSMDEDWGTAPPTDASKVRLRDVLKPRTTNIDYIYDFGDSWRHKIIVTKIRAGLPDVSYPNYVGGEWGCPPENCGGIPGYYNMLAALADPEHPDHAEVTEYLEDWDPKDIDEFRLRIALSRIANRRNAARTRLAKKIT